MRVEREREEGGPERGEQDIKDIATVAQVCEVCRPNETDGQMHPVVRPRAQLATLFVYRPSKVIGLVISMVHTLGSSPFRVHLSINRNLSRPILHQVK